MTPPILPLLLAALLSASKSEIPPSQWDCANDVEVWCAVDGCAARPEEETTPMSVSAGRDGRFSVCAYTGCWEGETEVVETAGRLLWVADGVGFSSQPEGGFEADITLLILEKDGVGFVRAGGIASPLLCARRPVDNDLDRENGTGGQG
ncbi:hypothetical protein [Hyphococcus sp.]|jgi:hypothetical protein|uniref:hypothetical protein n=1 Tax=Hyphococcus sp. TaxID=2038636 RepID=UPI003D11482D